MKTFKTISKLKSSFGVILASIVEEFDKNILSVFPGLKTGYLPLRNPEIQNPTISTNHDVKAGLIVYLTEIRCLSRPFV